MNGCLGINCFQVTVGLLKECRVIGCARFLSPTVFQCVPGGWTGVKLQADLRLMQLKCGQTSDRQKIVKVPRGNEAGTNWDRPGVGKKAFPIGERLQGKQYGTG